MTSESRLFSYVLRYDSGFAPHVFNGSCTLATCKPQIRRVARRGDWIVGTSSSRYSESSRRVVYLMQVTEEPIPLDAYDEMHPERRPSVENPLGDSIYFLDPVTGAFKQRPNPSHGPEHVARDLSGEAVLFSRRFVYFGDTMPEAPDDLDFVKSGPGFRCKFDNSVLRRLVAWADAQVGADGWYRSYGRANENNL